MFNKIMVGALSFALACTASLSANQLVVVAFVPNEINVGALKERTKKRFADHNVGFEAEGLSLNPLIRILSMQVKNENDQQGFGKALMKGLIEFFVKQGEQGVQKLFAETACLHENGFVNETTSYVELPVSLPQVHFEFAQTLSNAVTDTFREPVSVFNNTGIPFVILGRIPRFAGAGYAEFLRQGGSLSNIFPQASAWRFTANSFGIFGESANSSWQIGHITIKENGLDLVMGRSSLSLRF